MAEGSPPDGSTHPLDEKLVGAALRGDADVVGKILRRAERSRVRNWVMACDADGRTVLHLVSATPADGAVAVARKLLDNGAELDVQDHNGDTPLHLSAAQGNSALVQFFCDWQTQASGAARATAQPGEAGGAAARATAQPGGVDVMFQVFRRKNRDGLTPLECARRTSAAKCSSDVGCGDARAAFQILLAFDANDPADMVSVMHPERNATRPTARLLRYAGDGSARELDALLSEFKELNLERSDSSGFAPLHLAALGGHPTCVLLLLQAGAPADQQSDVGGKTALHFAARAAHAHTVAVLLENGASPNFADESGLSALHHALCSELPEGAERDASSSEEEQQAEHQTTVCATIDRLVRGGADPRALDKGGCAPIHYACERGRMHALRVLLEHDSSLCMVRDMYGFSPLQLAIRNRTLDALNILAECALECADATGGHFVQGFFYAVQSSAPSMVKPFLELLRRKGTAGSDLGTNGDCATALDVPQSQQSGGSTGVACGLTIETRAAGYGGRTVLHVAAEQGDAGVAELLLDFGADPCARDDLRDTPLAKAFVSAHDACSVALLRSSCNRGRSFLRTMLEDAAGALRVERDGLALLAAAKGMWDTLVYLLEEKLADVTVRSTRTGSTILHCISESTRAPPAALVHRLVALGADQNARNAENAVPLHLAAVFGHVSTVEALLAVADVGSGPLARDDDGNTPVFYSCTTGAADCVELLCCAEGGGSEAAAAACGANLMTPLHEAAHKGHVDCVAVLLRAKVPVDPLSRTGETPLLLSVASGHAEIVAELLAAGADAHRWTPQGARPVHVAVMMEHPDALLQLLKSCPSELNARTRDSSEMSPLALAVALKRTECRDLLQELGARFSVNQQG